MYSCMYDLVRFVKIGQAVETEDAGVRHALALHLTELPLFFRQHLCESAQLEFQV